MTAAVTDYTGLITSEHIKRPNFVAVVGLLASAFVDTINLTATFPTEFSVDTAVGVQLDVVGQWVGLSRVFPVPSSLHFFSWDSTPARGWDAGAWRGPFDPATGSTALPDDAYRNFLRSRIAANNWDGTYATVASVWAAAFPPGRTILVKDNQDMTMNITVVQPPTLTSLETDILSAGYVALKPFGVTINVSIA